MSSQTERAELIERLRAISVTMGNVDKAADMLEADADLLEALWVCMEHNHLHFGENHNTVIQASAAIAKATGGAK